MKMKNNNTSANDSFTDQDDIAGSDDVCLPLGEKNIIRKTSKVTALTSIIVISLIGNVCIVAVTLKTKRMRTATAFKFLMNMAIADLCTTVINMPESLVTEIMDSDQWIPGTMGMVLCKLLPFCQQVCAFSAILSLLIIALDRYFAINFPFRKLILQNHCKAFIATSWIVPGVSSLPMFVANNVIIETDGFILCIEEWPSPLDSMKSYRNYTIVLFVIFYLLPLIAISLIYSCIFSKLWKRKQPGNFLSSRSESVFSRSRRKTLKMFLAVVICFALCWLPFHVIFFMVTYDREMYICGIPVDLHFVSFFFGHAISALNPCICIIFNKDYRDGLRRIMRK